MAGVLLNWYLCYKIYIDNSQIFAIVQISAMIEHLLTQHSPLPFPRHPKIKIHMIVQKYL